MIKFEEEEEFEKKREKENVENEEGEYFSWIAKVSVFLHPW